MCALPVEGLPGDRYFPGMAVMDAIEGRAEELLLALFAPNEAYRATIQPHSGTQANQVVYNAVLGEGDVVLSLLPQEGGHISHKVLVGRRNMSIPYHLGNDGKIDYDALEALAVARRPKLIIAGGSACPREIDFALLGAIAHRTGALLHADISHTATFVAGGVHRPAAPHADFITFNLSKNLRGPNGGVLVYREERHTAVKRALFPNTQGGPNENAMFAKLVALEKLIGSDIRGYAQQMIDNARMIVETFRERGLRVVTGGTDCHLVLVDLRGHMSGLRAEQECERFRVLVNRNLIPNDNEKPWITSGIRIGTSCITILDYSNADVKRLAHWIADRVTEVAGANASALVDELTAKYNKALLPESRMTL
jgi:glycine hydroxymethyltransferase